MRIIEARVEPESCIMSDSWRAYLDIKISDKKYTHKMVNHSIHFVDPHDRHVHTQGVGSHSNMQIETVRHEQSNFEVSKLNLLKGNPIYAKKKPRKYNTFD